MASRNKNQQGMGGQYRGYQSPHYQTIPRSTGMPPAPSHPQPGVQQPMIRPQQPPMAMVVRPHTMPNGPFSHQIIQGQGGRQYAMHGTQANQPQMYTPPNPVPLTQSYYPSQYIAGLHHGMNPGIHYPTTFLAAPQSLPPQTSQPRNPAPPLTSSAVAPGGLAVMQQQMYYPQQPYQQATVPKRKRYPLDVVDPLTKTKVDLNNLNEDRKPINDTSATSCPPSMTNTATDSAEKEETKVPSSSILDEASSVKIHSDTKDSSITNATTTTTTATAAAAEKATADSPSKCDIHSEKQQEQQPLPPTSKKELDTATKEAEDKNSGEQDNSIVDQGLEPISPTPLPLSPPPSDESGSPKELITENAKHKKSKKKKADINRRGDEKTGSDMDAFADLTSPVSEKKVEVPTTTVVGSSSTNVATTSAAPSQRQQATSPISNDKESALSPIKVEEKELVQPVEVVKNVTTKIVKEESAPPSPPDSAEPVTTAATTTTPTASTDITCATTTSTVTSSVTSTTETAVSKTEESSPTAVNGEQESNISKSSSATKYPLKYAYKEDQWSPVNTEGKKQYDRDFLVQLQKDPMSMTKPVNLPDMDIIKSTANEFIKLNDRSKNQMTDFMPNFSERGQVTKSSSRGGALSKRPSRDGRGRGGMSGSGGRLPMDGGRAPIVISGLSFQEKVELRTTENAWKPSILKKNGADPCKDAEIEELSRKVRAILNKLTPQKFTVLIERFNDLPIDTEEKLVLCMEHIFEKAVDEPGFSVAYARMCEVLQKTNVAEAKFRSLLVNRCQKEFEKDYMKDVDKEQYERDMKAATTDEQKKAIRDVFEQQEREARRRSLGNIRFIGEIYKLHMLTSRIMHQCVVKLLTSADEESLECLCRLLSTIGKDLEAETKTNNEGSYQQFDSYFSRIQEVIKLKTTTNRVRFMLQDVVELRSSGWVPRRDIAGPKTIDQIHRDAEREKSQQQLMNYFPSRGDNRSSSRGPYVGNSGDKRSSRGPPTGNGQNPGNSEEGWNVVPTKKLGGFERIDMKQLRNIGNNKMDVENLQLGPGTRGGSIVSWGKGSGHRASKNEDPPLTQKNRFGSLSASTEREPSNEQRSSSLRGSRGPSIENDRDRSQRDMINFVKQKDTETMEWKGSPDLGEEEVKNFSLSIIDNFLTTCDYTNAIQSILEKMNPKTIKLFVDNCLDHTLEKTAKSRNIVGNLLSDLVGKNLLSKSQFGESVSTFCEKVPDLLVDIPKLWDYFSEFLVPMVEKGTFSLALLTEVTNSLREKNPENPCYGGRFVAGFVHTLVTSIGKDRVIEMWNASHLKIDSLIEPAIIKENKLEFLLPKNGSGELSHEEVRIKLMELLAKDGDDIHDWIDKYLGPKKMKEKWFIRMIVTECINDAIKVPDYSLKDETLERRLPLIKKYLDSDQDKQVQALYALQQLVHKLSHPSHLLKNLFFKLYDAGLIAEESYEAWFYCKDPAEQEGKGVAIKSTNQFFIWLKEADNEPDDKN